MLTREMQVADERNRQGFPLYVMFTVGEWAVDLLAAGSPGAGRADVVGQRRPAVIVGELD